MKNRIVPGKSGSGKGNVTITFNDYQVGLVLSCQTGSKLKFKIHTESSAVFTFDLFYGEKFDEMTDRYDKLEIVASPEVSWYWISKVDLDARV